MCQFISKKFPKIICPKVFDTDLADDKKKAFEALIKRIDSSPESLSNW
jgi:hypothetical protein